MSELRARNVKSSKPDDKTPKGSKGVGVSVLAWTPESLRLIE
jgi:hypothetical protein